MRSFPFALILFTVCTLTLSASAATEVVLRSFTGTNDGGQPSTGLIQDAAGNLYGTTFLGGSANLGVVFKLTRNGSSWRGSILHSFTGGAQDGANPDALLAVDAAGNLYGTTPAGGSSGGGTAFELSHTSSGGTQTILHAFSSGTPTSGLTFDSAGNLYGESLGGTSGQGTVYELHKTASGWIYRVLYNFAAGNDGAYPSGGLTFDSQHNLYGTTISGGGSLNAGTVFELKRANGTWAESVLHAFQGGADGVNPETAVTFDAAGNLYGTTVSGGSAVACEGYGCGTIFQLTPQSDGSWIKATLHAFTDAPDGGAPLGNLTFDAAGNFYGTTSNGGGPANAGTVFEFTPQSNGWSETILFAFTSGSDGGFPYSNIVIDSAGNLFGTTDIGGAFNYGVIFEVTGPTSH